MCPFHKHLPFFFSSGSLPYKHLEFVAPNLYFALVFCAKNKKTKRTISTKWGNYCELAAFSSIWRKFFPGYFCSIGSVWRSVFLISAKKKKNTVKDCRINFPEFREPMFLFD